MQDIMSIFQLNTIEHPSQVTHNAYIEQSMITRSRERIEFQELKHLHYSSSTLYTVRGDFTIKD